ncbi:MAG: hydrogenase expression/formation protein HypE [Flavobacteriaceae bacterium]|nr:hydrogenase expression/formation protein HypE [Flavobacteriaceae bacterium]
MKNTDHIHMGHGSGGTLTQELIDQIILKHLNNPILAQKHDGALLPNIGQIAISTDSFVINPIFFKGGNIGSLAVHGTVNDVAMCGAIPQYLSLAFIIEEGLPLTDFEKVVQSISAAAQESGVQIVTGDTKVVEKNKGDKIFINTTGIGKLHPKSAILSSRIAVGDKILLNANIAQHGIAILSQREGLQFESDILSDSTNLNHLVSDLLDVFGPRIKLFRDPTRGGLGSVLHELASEIEMGIHIEEKRLPIDKQVAAACEMLGLDPLHVANEGVFLCVVAAEIANDVWQYMQNHPKGKNANIIGEICSSPASKVLLESLIGGHRLVSPLIGQQLPRIC